MENSHFLVFRNKFVSAVWSVQYGRTNSHIMPGKTFTGEEKRAAIEKRKEEGCVCVFRVNVFFSKQNCSNAALHTVFFSHNEFHF